MLGGGRKTHDLRNKSRAKYSYHTTSCSWQENMSESSLVGYFADRQIWNCDFRTCRNASMDYAYLILGIVVGCRGPSSPTHPRGLNSGPEPVLAISETKQLFSFLLKETFPSLRSMTASKCRYESLIKYCARIPLWPSNISTLASAVQYYLP